MVKIKFIHVRIKAALNLQAKYANMQRKDP